MLSSSRHFFHFIFGVVLTCNLRDVHQNRGLSENVEVLRADNEAKSKIVQDYLLKEKVGIIGASSSSSPHKGEREEEHRSKLANISGSLVHLPANLSNLSPLTSKKKASAQVENVMGTNKKLQDVVEETMMKNIQLQVMCNHSLRSSPQSSKFCVFSMQELIKNMGNEIESLKGQLKEKQGK